MTPGGSTAVPASSVDPTPRTTAVVRHAVLEWGGDHRRDLPWRRTRDPWAILVSEVMLQQTQVARVLGPYHRFLESFPTPRACADAGSAEVVRAWEGLGYNRRARSLHLAAVAVVEHHAGRVPDRLDALETLPGVGAYTARAVLAFAYEQDVAPVDTNVARLLARAVAGRPLRVREAQALADRLVPPGESWAFNQSLFDIGSRHCRSVGPECDGCPLAPHCQWRRAGRPAPDPAVASAGTSRPQSRFSGSDRQGRGRLVAALREGRVAASGLAAATGWPDDPARAQRVADGLVADGLVRRDAAGVLHLA